MGHFALCTQAEAERAMLASKSAEADAYKLLGLHIGATERCRH
jgi:hypothetical protein